MRKMLVVALSLTILFMVGCNQKLDVREDFYNDSIIVAKMVDDAMEEKKELSVKEEERYKKFLSSYINENDRGSVTDLEINIESEIANLYDWQSLYIKAIDTNKPKGDLEFINNKYQESRENLIKLLDIEKFTTD